MFPFPFDFSRLWGLTVDLHESDRMLVKTQWSRSTNLPTSYDAYAQRKEPANRSESWEEMMVVMRKGTVEIWQDWVSLCSLPSAVLTVDLD